MQEHEVVFEAYLEKKGLKLTQPRKLILNTVFDLHEHFDVEQLYDIIHKISKDVSRATVYRIIPLLVEAGLIQKSIRVEAREKYEHIFGHPRHAHWVCKKCGNLLETDMQDILKLVQSKAKAQQYRITDVNLEIKGLCWKCQNNEIESQ